MENVSIDKSIHLSEHFTLGEVTKSKHAEIYNIPSHVAIENLKRVCEWLEELRRRYNLRYVLRSVSPPKFFAEQSGKAERGGVRGGLRSALPLATEGTQERGKLFTCSDHPTLRAPLLARLCRLLPKGRKNSGGEEITRCHLHRYRRPLEPAHS